VKGYNQPFNKHGLRWLMGLRLSGFAIALGMALGMGIFPAQAEVTNSQVNTLVEVLRLNAPPASPTGERLYSEWKVKGDNIPRWSQKCIGRSLTPELFEASPVTTRWILACVLRDTLQTEYKASGNNEAIAIRRAAAWWMTGNPDRYATGETGTYTQRVLAAYQQKQPPTATPTATKPVAPKPAETKPASSSEPSSPPSAIAPNPASVDKKPDTLAAPVAKPATAPETAPSQSRLSIYDRYMQAAYDATKKRDKTTALLYFRRALDERPGDTYATQAIQNLDGASGASRSQTPSTSNPTQSSPARRQSGSSVFQFPVA
jgi:hypothetical protein